MNRGTAVIFIDVLALMLIVLFLLPMKPDVRQDDDARVGSVVVEAHWPDNFQTDVDLWVRSPGDNPVGYSRLRGRDFSLFRDDLGMDRNPWRYEIAASRSIPDGEYIVNLHLFNDSGRNAPLSVSVVVWFRTENGTKIEVWSGSAVLKEKGHETTVVRWRMSDAAMVPGSIHYSQTELRAVRPPL